MTAYRGAALAGQVVEKKLSLKKIRALVFARAKGRCECGCQRPITPETGRLDHFFGRSRAESVETCWGLSVQCDEAKTNNRPSSIVWCRRFFVHARRHGYAEEIERVTEKGLVLRQKGLT